LEADLETAVAVEFDAADERVDISTQYIAGARATRPRLEAIAECGPVHGGHLREALAWDILLGATGCLPELR
jgi:hypothetical protein